MSMRMMMLMMLMMISLVITIDLLHHYRHMHSSTTSTNESNKQSHCTCIHSLNNDNITITIFIGLQSFIDDHPSAVFWSLVWSTFIKEHDLSVKQINMNSLELIVNTMLSTTTGYPKIHSVWYYFCSFIIPLSQQQQQQQQHEQQQYAHHGNHHHSSKRMLSLTLDQLSSLKTLSHFIDNHLIPHSIEKRSVAFHLVHWLLTHCPADYCAIALSKPVIKCLISCRTIKKHPLHDVAGDCTNVYIGADQ
jgi:hypothetical protein